MNKSDMEKFIIDNNMSDNYFVRNDIDGKPHILDYECEESLFYYYKDEMILKDYATDYFKIVNNKIEKK